MLGVRLTQDEEERLEQLRQQLRLRSFAEVVRFALQVLECVCNGSRIEADSADEVVANVKSCLPSEQQQQCSLTPTGSPATTVVEVREPLTPAR
jgi:hypothetical protein